MARLLGGVPVQEQLDTQLAPEQERQFRHWVGQREERMPAQYIVGRQMLAMHVRPQRADELAAVVQAAGFRVETVPGSEAVYPTTVIGTMGAV